MDLAKELAYSMMLFFGVGASWKGCGMALHGGDPLTKGIGAVYTVAGLSLCYEVFVDDTRFESKNPYEAAAMAYRMAMDGISKRMRR
ncbi:MAG: hypothetical protein ABIA12_00425 [Candidatus Aenigmatarchaeota archaeon]